MKSVARLREEECVRRCLAGDPDAFEPIYTAWVMYVRHYVSARIQGPDVDDIVQTAFLRAFETLDKFDPDFRISTWLLVHARNSVAEFMWKRDPCRRHGWMRVPDWTLRSADDPSAVAAARIACERMTAAWADVPAFQRRTLEDFTDGAEEGQLAEREGVTRGAISMRIMAARRQLRSAIGD